MDEVQNLTTSPLHPMCNRLAQTFHIKTTAKTLHSQTNHHSLALTAQEVVTVSEAGGFSLGQLVPLADSGSQESVRKEGRRSSSAHPRVFGRKLQVPAA